MSFLSNERNHMKKLTNYEKHFLEEMRDPRFQKGYEKEYAKVKFAYQMMQLRKKQRISQAQLAKKLGTTQSVVARMEAGQQNFTLETLQRIAAAFGRNLNIKFT
jgi:ribosome-binding protein aMBF1 (putative translation factor)